jgi:hypothetical protein
MWVVGGALETRVAGSHGRGPNCNAAPAACEWARAVAPRVSGYIRYGFTLLAP